MRYEQCKTCYWRNNGCIRPKGELCPGRLGKQSKEPVSEDLEEAAEKFVYDWAGLSPTERRIAERAYLAGAEWMAEQFRKELDKWEDHSIRGMEKGNVAYFQGRIGLICNLEEWLKKEDEA